MYSYCFCNWLYYIHLFILSGAYGTVYKARDTINDTIVAIKKVKLGLTEDGVPMQVDVVVVLKETKYICGCFLFSLSLSLSFLSIYLSIYLSIDLFIKSLSTFL